MARPFRCQYAGAIYHVTVRGNERRAIFRDKQDFLRFIAKLQTLVELHHVRLYEGEGSGLAIGNWRIN